MIVLKTNFVESMDSTTSPILVISAGATGGYQISRLNMGEGPPVNINADTVDPWGRKVYYWSAYGDGFIEAKDYEESRDYDAFMRSRFGCVEGPVFVVGRGAGQDFVVVPVVPTYTDLPFENQIGYGPTISAIEQAIPGYSESQRAKQNKAKRDLLEQISPVAMLAEQEKQIDLLSLLVLELAEKQPAQEQPAWLADFKAIVEQHSSTQFKGVSGALADVGERKARMRELQRAYFAQRGY